MPKTICCIWSEEYWRLPAVIASIAGKCRIHAGIYLRVCKEVAGGAGRSYALLAMLAVRCFQFDEH